MYKFTAHILVVFCFYSSFTGAYPKALDYGVKSSTVTSSAHQTLSLQKWAVEKYSSPFLPVSSVFISSSINSDSLFVGFYPNKFLEMSRYVVS